MRGVDFSHGDTRVLSGVTLDVAPGRTVAVVGATGSGKSSLASLLVRLVDPDAGAVSYDGQDVRSLVPGALPEVAALVPQSAFLFDDSVRDNVTLGADVPDEQVWAALRTAQADGFVAALPAGLDTVVGERGTTLSGGQRQRLALARAVVRRPRLLVLDDATSAVDPTVERRILDGLRGGSGTVVVVAYRQATIDLADEVVWVEDGRVVDRGSSAEIAARTPGYRDLVTAYSRAAAGREQDRADEAEAVRVTATTTARTGDRRGAHRCRRAPCERGTAATLLHGLRIVPEFRRGLVGTLLLAVLATAGRVVVPVAVQQTIDQGLSGPVPDTGLVQRAVLLAGLAVLITAWASYRMNVRLYRSTEAGLAELRVRAFRRVHDLSVLHQATERRGSLVSRVTGDVDTLSTFMQWGGLLLVVSSVQVLLATALMAYWSWQLTLLVYVCFLPLLLAVRHVARRLHAAYRLVRERVGELLGRRRRVGRRRAGDPGARHPGAHRRPASTGPSTGPSRPRSGRRRCRPPRRRPAS